MSHVKIEHIQIKNFIHVAIEILDKLSPHDLYLYCFLKKECMIHGSCTLSFKEIVKSSKLSRNKTAESLKNLQSLFKFVEYGGPLIIINHRYDEDGGCDSNEILINEKILF